VFERRLLCNALAIFSLTSAGLAQHPQSVSQPEASRELHIAAAADLQPLLPPLLTQFEQQTGIHATASY
jgi:ABC-type molybdate transport system substrate-binding protein